MFKTPLPAQCVGFLVAATTMICACNETSRGEEDDVVAAPEADEATRTTVEDPKTPSPAASGGGVQAVNDLMAHIPAGANFVGVINVERLLASDLAPVYEHAMQGLSGETAMVTRVAEACNVGPGTWTALVIAGDTGKPDASMAVLVGPDVGKKTTLECFVGKSKEFGAAAPWTLAHDERQEYSINVGRNAGKAIAADDDTLIVATRGYVKPVTRRFAGEISLAPEDSLRDALGATDTDKTVFFAGFPEGKMAKGPMAGVEHASGTVEGHALGLTLNYTDATKAKAAAAQLETQLQPFASIVPSRVLETMKITIDGATVRATHDLTSEDLELLEVSVARTLGGKPAGEDDGPSDDELDPEDLMMAAACDAKLEGGEPSVATIQKWVCHPQSIHDYLDPERGLYMVRAGENPNNGNTSKHARVRCGAKLEPLASKFAAGLLPKLLSHLEGDKKIECSADACDLPGLIEYDGDLRLTFRTEAGTLFLDTIIDLDVVLVDESVVTERRAWAEKKVAARPRGCPTD